MNIIIACVLAIGISAMTDIFVAGCPDGWVETERMCYKYMKDSKKATWEEARKRCDDLDIGATLPWFADEAEHDEFKDYIEQNDPDHEWRVWLAITDKANEGDFQMVPTTGNKGRPPIFPWSRTNPSNYAGDEDCVEYYHAERMEGFQWRVPNTWNDNTCSDTLDTVCQYRPEKEILD